MSLPGSWLIVKLAPIFLLILFLYTCFHVSIMYNNNDDHMTINFEFETNEINPWTGNETDLLNKLKSIVKCKKKDFSSKIQQWGNFWALQNFIKANHGELECYETITYTTHADYSFLDNIIPLLERWEAPLSVAVYAPGYDFDKSIEIILQLRNCHPRSDLVRQFATFHLYFQQNHLPPKPISDYEKMFLRPFTCLPEEKKENVEVTYRKKERLFYPVNFGRNLARDAALTHLILACDIELYPNPGVAHNFLKMIVRKNIMMDKRNVFVLPVFEIEKNLMVPRNKTELQTLFKSGKVVNFHAKICSYCHKIPKLEKWIAKRAITDELSILTTTKREGEYEHWEPVYIGTHSEPYYDDRLSWEGKLDKMTQGYIMCILNYNFVILDNTFLIHRPGIKTQAEASRPKAEIEQRNFIVNNVTKELIIFYGSNKKCKI